MTNRETLIETTAAIFLDARAAAAGITFEQISQDLEAIASAVEDATDYIDQFDFSPQPTTWDVDAECKRFEV